MWEMPTIWGLCGSSATAAVNDAINIAVKSTFIFSCFILIAAAFFGPRRWVYVLLISATFRLLRRRADDQELLRSSAAHDVRAERSADVKHSALDYRGPLRQRQQQVRGFQDCIAHAGCAAAS